jgi:L,D-transpeptidase YcbB
LNADEEGLSADDYDGPRWRDRLSKLIPDLPHPKESDAIEFDVALTVSMMRFLSDLHLGKANPQHSDFEFVAGEKKYSHASGSAQRDAVNLLEQQLFPNVPKLES